MTKWEYLAETWQDGEWVGPPRKPTDIVEKTRSVVEVLNHLGSNGWELVSVTRSMLALDPETDGDDFLEIEHYFFKRPVL